MDPIQRLHDARLHVKTSAGIYRILKLAHGRELSADIDSLEINGDGTESAAALNLSDRRGILYFENDLWIFRVWEHIPGPGLDDFAYGYQDLDDAVEAVLNYYLGKPTRIDGWWIPLHRHPYLDPEEVRRVVTEARLISEVDFETLKKIRADQFASEDRRGGLDWEESGRPEAVMRLQYIQCVPIIPANSRLLLRRDAQEAFVVVYHGDIPPVSA